MQDTLVLFDQIKTEDKDFFSKLKLDKDNIVENIFWVDGPAHRAYKAGCNDCILFNIGISNQQIQYVVRSIYRDKQSWAVDTVRVWICPTWDEQQLRVVVQTVKLVMWDIASKNIIIRQDTRWNQLAMLFSRMQTTEIANGTSCKMQQKS
jgi:hypothetical protein